MKNECIYIFLLLLLLSMLLPMKCWADTVDVSAYKTADLNFGKAVLLATSGSVNVRSTDGEPLWLRCMKSSSGEYPSVGQIEFSSSMTDGYDVLLIKPNLTASEINIAGVGCSLQIKNLSLSAASKYLTMSENKQTFNIGGALIISDSCTEDYEYEGEISVHYEVLTIDMQELKQGNVTVPVKFSLESLAEVIKDADMNFGVIITDGTAGSVTLSTLGNILSISEGLSSLGGQSEGQISIFGTPNMQISGVNYDSSIQLCLDGNSNNACMIVDDIIHIPQGSFRLNESRNNQGYKMVHIGGTLHIEDNQPAGEYSGVLHIQISY